MSKLGPRKCSSDYALRRTNLCSSEPQIIDGQTANELRDLVAEQTHEVAGDVQLKRMNPATTSSIYGESTQKQWLPLVSLKAIVNVTPNMAYLVEHGVREPVDIAIIFAYNDLTDAGVTEVTIKDRIIFAGKEYQVYQANPEGYVQNLPARLHVAGKIWSGQAVRNQP